MRGGSAMCVLRIMLAAHLAIWTPAWCCCMIKAAAGKMTGVATAGCADEGCCSRRAPVRSIQRASCCAKSAQENCCEGEDGRVAGGPIEQAPSPCSCHNELNDVVRLDTGSRVSIAALSVDLHA